MDRKQALHAVPHAPKTGRGPILLVAAHPDDEVIGAGIQLQRWSAGRVTILHVTDGSPRDLRDARAAGFDTREAYAHERRRELYRALEFAGIRPDQCMQFKYADQEACLNLVPIVERLSALIHQLRPECVYTHPYEGGHPDHDALAFAVAQLEKCEKIEFTSYHAGPSGMITGEFLNGAASEVLQPTPEESQTKQKMLKAFKTQEHMLHNFVPGPERFRPAPQYDFTQPPHPGPLHYETLGWDITGEQWRAKAVEALKLLEGRRKL